MEALTQFYTKPRLTIIALLVVLVGAFAAIGTLGRQEDPTLIERFGNLTVTLPGADAEQIESLLTEPIESALLELPEIKELVSFSATGRLQIRMEMRDELSEQEVEEAWSLIQGQLDSVQSSLPAQVETFRLERLFLAANTIIVNLSWRGEGEPPLNVMARLAQDLTLKLRNLTGTEFAESFGLPREEVRVIPNEEMLASLGVSLQGFAAAIAQSDTRTPAGQLRTSEGNITFEVDGEINSLARLEELPILASGSGSILQLRDIATIERGVEYPPRAVALSDGVQGIFVSATISPGLRVDLWTKDARAIVDEFATSLPENLAIEVLFEQNEYTMGRLTGLVQNLAFSALIVFFVVWATLGIRGAIVVGSALPLTIACVLCVFLLTGEALHQMSITGLVIALGLLIDNAIVVVDEYEQERAKGVPPLEAISKVLRFLFAPLAASTLTTILAFTPIAILPGPAGEFVGMLGVSVILAVGSSFLLALTVIPAFAGWLDSGDVDPDRRKVFWRDGINLPIMGEGYLIFLQNALRTPLLTVFVCLVIVSAGMYFVTVLPSQFFPATERNQLGLAIDLPSNASVVQTTKVAKDVTDLLLQQDGVTHVHLVVGEPPTRVYYNSLDLGEGFEGRASGWVQFDTAKRARSSAQFLQDLVTDRFPQYQISLNPFSQGPPVDAPIEALIYGEDLAVLDRIGQQIRLIMSETPGVTFTAASLALSAPVLTFDANETDKAVTGQSGVGFVSALRAQTQGIPVSTIQEDYQQIPVIVRSSMDRRRSVDSILDTSMASLNGATTGVSLADLGTTRLISKTSFIVRDSGRRVNSVKAYLDPYHLPDPALEVFQQKLMAADIQLPEGYALDFGGDAEASDETNSSLTALALPIFLIMFGGISLVFNSFRLGAIIMLSGVLSMGFAFAAIAFFNLPLGFNGIIGVLSLLGIAINGSIVVAALLQDDELARSGDTDQQAVVVVKATRHIVATTLTTIGGFVPLLIQADSFWMPFASAIAGGAAGSAILALVFTPAMCRIFVMRPRKAPMDVGGNDIAISA